MAPGGHGQASLSGEKRIPAKRDSFSTQRMILDPRGARNSRETVARPSHNAAPPEGLLQEPELQFLCYTHCGLQTHTRGTDGQIHYVRLSRVCACNLEFVTRKLQFWRLAEGPQKGLQGDPVFVG